MHTGMLWFNNHNKSLTENIQEAKDYYQKKYSRLPDLCLVHPSALNGFAKHEGNRLEIQGIATRPYRPVLPGHIWIGIEDKPA